MKFCPFALKILSGDEIITSNKGHNTVKNVQKVMCNNPNIDLVNINILYSMLYIYTPIYRSLVKFYQFVLDILSVSKNLD